MHRYSPASLRCLGSLLLLSLVLLGASSFSRVWWAPSLLRAAEEAKSSKVDPAALERARQTVQMLDDVYKLAVISITKNYTEKQGDTPAAEVAKEVFAGVHKKGWHKGRLIDATGKPKNKKNVAETDFEKKAVEVINSGKGYYEEVATAVDGKPVLRAATVVPSVMKQCAICHGGKEGRVLGAIIYELPIK